jgi:hypothetical protein
MTIGPFGRWEDGDGEAAGSPDELSLPATARLRRCSALHDVGTGPWIGTMACCTRPVGHDGDHTMSLGDPGSPSHWEETWP